jgi:hypothetical protein
MGRPGRRALKGQRGKGLDQLLDNMSTYYAVAYQAPAHSKTGYRKIKVDVRRKGMSVRARREYYSLATGAK